VENVPNAFAQELSRVKSSAKRRLKTLKKSLKKAQDRLNECQNWRTHQHTAELLQSHLYLIKKGDKEVIVSDWENENAPVAIPLDLKVKPFEEVAAKFKQATKLKKGLPYALKEVERTEEALISLEALLEALELVQTQEELDALNPPKPQTPVEKSAKAVVLPYLEYISDTGIPIWVGKNAAKNDELTFRYASGNDLWLHVADYPGSHVVIHPKSGQTIDDITMKKALHLALFYSKAKKFKEGEVSYTQVKYVRRFGKQKGKVQISNQKKVYVRLE
jgi:predicted ribosome quality control (RQC) complex YloA/Tae2 family protein